MPWFKGNLHTHTTNSDGDASPGHVAGWYEAHGYDWLCLSDHNHLTVLEDERASGGRWPMLLRGEEVTSLAGEVPVHLNAYGIKRLVEPSTALTVIDSLRDNVARIRAAGGLAAVNHPNYKWAFSHSELLEVDGYRFVEIFNGHPFVHNEGGGGSPGYVEIWDRLLSADRRVLGIAVDDSHHYTGEFGSHRSNPGRGWVQVRSDRLSENGVMEALDRGDFYSSTGVVLGELASSEAEIKIEIEPESNRPDNVARYTTVFTGPDGRVLDRVEGNSAAYRPGKSDGYVRATVLSSRGTRAWTQPVFTGG